MNKYIALGALMGIVLGIIFIFTNTWILEEETKFRIAMNEKSGFPSDYYSTGGGSIWAVGSLIPLLAGVVGALGGYLFLILFGKKKI